jgi:triosephosphate isomerase
MSRKKIIAGNWKVNKTVPEALALVADLKALLADMAGADVVVVPPFTALYPVGLAVEDTNIDLGAQNIFWKPSGAYTSQISGPMLTDVGVKYVIIGHSEPRGRFGVPEKDAPADFYRYFGESDYTVNLKVIAALKNELIPIICVGETLDERKAEKTDSVIREQVIKALNNVDAGSSNNIVFAYEPVWAIGTGEVCGATEADRVCGVIRDEIGNQLGKDVADAVRIQYGGSMKPDNAAELLSKPNIDGGLIGGAALKAADFAAIVKAAQ